MFFFFLIIITDFPAFNQNNPYVFLLRLGLYHTLSRNLSLCFTNWGIEKSFSYNSTNALRNINKGGKFIIYFG